MDDPGIWIAVGVGALATYFSRFIGVVLSGRIAPNGAVFEWVACTAYALLAGLIARMIVLPVGSLQETTNPARLLAAALALIVFFLFRKNLVAGIAAGVGFFVACIHWGWL